MNKPRDALKVMNQMVRDSAREFDVPEILDRCDRMARSALRKHGVTVPKHRLPDIPAYAEIEVRRLGKILLRIHDIRDWLSDERPEAKRFAVRYALDLGQLAFAAGVGFEPLASEAREHQNTRAGGARGGEKKHKNQRPALLKKREEILLRADELKLNHPEWKRHSIAVQIAKEFPIGSKTVNNLLKNSPEKLPLKNLET